MNSTASKEIEARGLERQAEVEARFPIVSARSAKIGPNVAAASRTSPVAGSVVYANPPDEDGKGKVVSWVAIA